MSTPQVEINRRNSPQIKRSFALLTAATSTAYGPAINVGHGFAFAIFVKGTGATGTNRIIIEARNEANVWATWKDIAVATGNTTQLVEAISAISAVRAKVAPYGGGSFDVTIDVLNVKAIEQGATPATIDWSNLTNKPATFSPSAHTHAASEISDSTAPGRALLTAASVAAQRAALDVKSVAENAALRNALAPAQALSFNGTAGSTIANAPAFGTGDFSFAYVVNIASFADSNFLHSGDANAPVAYISTSGSIVTGKRYGAENVGSGAGSVVLNTPTVISYTRSGTTGKYYVNGTLLATITDSLDYAGVIATIGKQFGGSQFFTGTLRPLGIANRALSAAEVLSVYQTGSFPASDFGQGVNESGTTVYAGAQMINGANSTFASDSGWWVMTGGTNIAAGVANFVANSTISRTSILTVGKRYRATFTLTASGGTFKVQDGATFFLTGLTTGTQSFEFVAGGTSFGISSVEATGTVDNLTITPLGLLVAPDPMQLGSGPQWRDMSGNNAHINLPGDGVDGGVAWTNRSPEGWFTYTRTSSGYLFGGWAIIPSGYYIAEMWISGNGAAAITVGESAGTWTNVVASFVPSATPAPVTLLVRTTSNRMLYLYMSASASVTVTVRIAKIG